MIFSSTRRFQLWEYRVSHGSLLIRSPRGPEEEANIDLIFDGVEFILCPRMLRGLELIEAEPADIEAVTELIGVVRGPDQIFVVSSGERRFFIVASSCRTEENFDDIFSSPFG